MPRLCSTEAATWAMEFGGTSREFWIKDSVRLKIAETWRLTGWIIVIGNWTVTCLLNLMSGSILGGFQSTDKNEHVIWMLRKKRTPNILPIDMVSLVMKAFRSYS